MAPGNKNGWSQEQGGWVINSVGFAGPNQRYTLAVMNALNGEGGYDDGVQTTTHLAALLQQEAQDGRFPTPEGKEMQNRGRNFYVGGSVTF